MRFMFYDLFYRIYQPERHVQADGISINRSYCQNDDVLFLHKVHF